MVDTCTIVRPSGEPSWDPTTGTYTDPPTTVMYAGPCRVKPVSRDRGNTEQGVREVTTSRYDVALPHDTPYTLVIGDRLTVTASTDGWLIDRPLMVTGVGLGSSRTARWVSVEDQHG